MRTGPIELEHECTDFLVVSTIQCLIGFNLAVDLIAPKDLKKTRRVNNDKSL